MVHAGEDGSQSDAQTGQAPDAAPSTRPSTPCIRPSTPSTSAIAHGVPMEQDYDEEEEDDDDDIEKEQEEADLGRIGRLMSESIPDFPSTNVVASTKGPEAVELADSTVALLLMAQKEEWSRLLDEVAKSRAVVKHREFQLRTLKEIVETQKVESQKAQAALFSSDCKKKELERELHEVLDDLNQCKERMASMRLSAAAVEQLADDLKQSKDMQRQLNQKLVAMLEDKKESDKRQEGIMEQMQKYRKTLVIFANESRAIEQRTKGLMKHMTDREKTLTDLTGERDAAKKKIALLEESVAAKESLLSQLKERLAHTSDLLEREKSNCRRFEEERTLLSIELASARNRNVDLSFQLSQKNGELSETVVHTQSEKAGLMSSLQRLQNEVNDKASRIVRLEEEMSKAKNDGLAKDSETSQLKGKIAELEGEMASMRRRNQELTILSEIMQSRDDHRPRSSSGRPGSSGRGSNQQNQNTSSDTSQRQTPLYPPASSGSAQLQQPSAPQQGPQTSSSSNFGSGNEGVSRPNTATTGSTHQHKRIRVEDDEDDDDDLLRDPFAYNPSEKPASRPSATAQSAQPQAQQQQSQQQKRAAKPSASTASQGSRKREKKRGNSSKGADDTDGCCPLCKDPSLGLMYLCPMCLKEFHASCVKSHAGGKSVSARGFICSDCS